MNWRTALFFPLASVALAQSVSFDAASIKPSAPLDGHMVRFGSSGGPGTSDPGLFKCESCQISALIMQAYDIKRYQLSGQSTAVDGDRFDVSARIPAGASKEQFRLMLRNLLAERFGVRVHHETKELPVFELVVAKGGPKLKESTLTEPAEPAPPPPGGMPRMARDKDGYPTLPPGSNGMIMVMNGRARTQGSGQTMEQFAGFLGNQTGKPVTDKTGLKGKYDYTLSWAMDMSSMRMGGPGMPPPPGAGEGGPLPKDSDADSGPTLFTALQEQLGLKLEPKKGPVDIVVVDHAEKKPTEN